MKRIFIKEFMQMFPHLIKDIIKGIMNIYLVIVWLIMLPFIYIFDRIFGGWKDNEKNKNNVR